MLNRQQIQVIGKANQEDERPTFQQVMLVCLSNRSYPIFSTFPTIVLQHQLDSINSCDHFSRLSTENFKDNLLQCKRNSLLQLTNQCI